jgi:hypothetical protein
MQALFRPHLAVAALLFASTFAARAAAEPQMQVSDEGPVACRRQGGWFIADSPNFQVCSRASEAEAMLTAHRCESVRRELVDVWNPAAPNWSPCCQIVLHADHNCYARQVGPDGASTLGSSLVKPETGAIKMRRIDLRTDVDDVFTAALPHELCHVVLADRFRHGRPPLWFDEGVALLYDPPAKLRLHRRDLRDGLQRGVAFSAGELMSLRSYPSPDRWGVFYGQCAVIVDALRERGTSDQLLTFVDRVPTKGVDGALREIYDIKGAPRFDRLWQSPFGQSQPCPHLPVGRDFAPHFLAVPCSFLPAKLASAH